MTSPMLWATRGATVTLALAFTAAGAAAQQAPASDETIHGTVDSLPEHYTLILKDARGFVDTVTLRDDTVVNPANLELTSGLSVTIHGHTSGKTFVADEVDGPQDAAGSGDAAPQAPPPAPPQYAQPDQGYDTPADGPYDGPAYDAPPAYGYDEAPDVIYGAPYVGPAFGIVIGGGGYGYYGGPYGYYGGPYGYYGGYYGPGYYHGYPGGYHHAPGTSAPVRTPLPIRRAPGYGYPTGTVRSGYPGSGYANPGYGTAYHGYSSYGAGSSPARSYSVPSRSYAAPSSTVHVTSSSSHGSSSPHR